MTQHTINVQTRGRGLTDITAQISALFDPRSPETGLAHIFVHHTSASLIIQENADPDVRQDLDAFFARLVPDGDPLFTHVDEGPDDMSAHIRSVLTATHLTVPITGGQLALGTWQGIYLWEHRTRPHTRRLTITFMG
jgi:secondary thiamine-phosphate synthase enzyme